MKKRTGLAPLIAISAILLDCGEERLIGRAVIFESIDIFQLDVVAVVIGQRDEVGAEILTHGDTS